MCYTINTVEFRPQQRKSSIMYVKVYSRHRGQWEPLHVVEMSKGQLREQKKRNAHRLHLVITGSEAHKWVRQGGIHGTSLYIDQDNRIRRAGE
jgi:hypothetical protein